MTPAAGRANTAIGVCCSPPANSACTKPGACLASNGCTASGVQSVLLKPVPPDVRMRWGVPPRWALQASSHLASASRTAPRTASSPSGTIAVCVCTTLSAEMPLTAATVAGPDSSAYTPALARVETVMTDRKTSSGGLALFCFAPVGCAACDSALLGPARCTAPQPHTEGAGDCTWLAADFSSSSSSAAQSVIGFPSHSTGARSPAPRTCLVAEAGGSRSRPLARRVLSKRDERCTPVDTASRVPRERGTFAA